MDEVFDKLFDEITNTRKEGETEYRDFVRTYWEKPDTLLATIILGHMFIESCVNKLLGKAFAKPEKLLESRFQAKIDVLEAAGIIKPSMIKRMRALNKARNKIAHQIGWSFAEELAREFSNDPEDIALWKKDPARFMFGEISFLAGYIYSVIAGQRKIRSKSYSLEEVKAMQEFWSSHRKNPGSRK